MRWGAFISTLLESINERLAICKDDERTVFNHMAEVFDGLIHCLELSVVRSATLFERY